MKILILRTIAHNRIWEGKEPFCHYEELSYKIMKKWEPDIVQKNINEVSYGFGIYTRMYYSYVSPTGQRAYTNTPEEHQPSLLKMKPINSGSVFYGTESRNPDNIKISFEFIKKLSEIDKNTMLEIDNLLIAEKMRTYNIDRNLTKYPSLCFTLEEDIVKSIMQTKGVNLGI